MSFAALTLAAALLSPGMQASQPSPADIGRLAWLAGCWSRSRPQGQVEEHWMAPAGGSMLGMSRTVSGGKTVEYEFLRIAEVDGRLAYAASPSGQATATFPVKSMEDGAVVFENPTHDFPQRIIYRRQQDGAITARIEGTLNGKASGRDFPYQRCPQ